MPLNTTPDAPKFPHSTPTPAALGFINRIKDPSCPVVDFEMTEWRETPFCAIRVIAEITRAPWWKKYHLVLRLRVYQAQGNELLMERCMRKKTQTIEEALQFFGFRQETPGFHPGVR